MHPAPRFAAAPRRVPASLVVANVFNGFGQFGWFFFGFGMIFFWVFGASADLSFLKFGSLAQTSGQVTQVEATAASENEQPVYANYYAFSLAGRRHTGVSYVTGSAATVGETVEIEYDASDPSWSRIAGMRRAMFGSWALLFALIFPGIGLTIALFSLRSGLRRARLLRNGQLAMGKLVGKEATSTTVNKRRVYELTFEFITREGQRREAKARTTFPHTLEDERQEPLLYDPQKPNVVYVLDEVPGRPHVDGMGELEGQPLTAFARFIIPALAIGGNVLVALYRFDVL
ncbi:MAG TPA: DUF3592 domain-containing protein [Thermoanaerobaculia bacterium]|jgi:hypothetical protein